MHAEMANHRQAVGRRFKALRQNRRLSQEDAAQLADVSLTTWRNWERGKVSPYERNWEKLRDGFGLTEEELGAVRGTPPAPLGMGDPAAGQLDRIEGLLVELSERLGRLEDLVTERELEDLEAEDEPGRPATRTRADRRAANDA
jgi:transcriptional regulator with XRE-family HTH domain